MRLMRPNARGAQGSVGCAQRWAKENVLHTALWQMLATAGTDVGDSWNRCWRQLQEVGTRCKQLSRMTVTNEMTDACMEL